MTQLDIIKSAAAKLSTEELEKLRAYLDELAEQAFDDRIARDTITGKPDHLAAEALAEHQAGKTRRLRYDPSCRHAVLGHYHALPARRDK
jgi:hypothetical protein